MTTLIQLSPTLTNQLQTQATRLGFSLNDFVEKLVYQSLAQLEFSKQFWQEPVEEPISTPVIDEQESVEDKPSSMSELVAQIKSRPLSMDGVHPPTGTLDDVLAAFETDPPATPPLTPEEWEMHWWPIREEMRERDELRYVRFEAQREGIQ